MIWQDHESWQVIVLRTQRIAHPTPSSGKPWQLKARGLQQSRGAVDAGLTDHIMNESHVVDDRAQRGGDFAEHLAGTSVRLEVPERSHPRSQTILEGFDLLTEIAGLPVALNQLGLVIIEVEMTRRTRHEKLDDPLGLGRMMQATRELTRRGQRTISPEERSQGEATQTAARLPEKIAPAQRRLRERAMKWRSVAHRLIDEGELVEVEKRPAGSRQALLAGENH